MTRPYLVEFPLRGEWLSPTTPGKQIPSHGTDQLGSRYAYDFVQVDWERKGWPSYRVSPLRYVLLGVPLSTCYCWGQEIYAPCDGVIVQAKDGWKERRRAHVITDSLVALKSAHAFDPRKDDIQAVAGNFVIMKCAEGVYAGLVHLQQGSVRVSAGQQVKKGDILGNVGHSGNSFTPHLHFQLMDSEDITTAQGIPCAFERYEVFEDGAWTSVREGIPADKDHLRFNG